MCLHASVLLVSLISLPLTTSTHPYCRFGVFCRYCEAKKTLFVINLLNATTSISLDIAGGSAAVSDVLTGQTVNLPMILAPLQLGLYTLHVPGAEQPASEQQ